MRLRRNKADSDFIGGRRGGAQRGHAGGGNHKRSGQADPPALRRVRPLTTSAEVGRQ